MLPMLLVTSLISLSLFLLLNSSTPFIDASIHSSELVSPTPPFLDTYSLSMLSFSAKASQKSTIFLLFDPFLWLPSELTDGFSLESKKQQVSSSLQDSSQYSGWSRQCCSLDILHSSSFPIPPVLVPIILWLYQAHKLQLVTPSFSCSIVFQFSSKV